MDFQTHGPFKFEDWSPQGVRDFYSAFTAQFPELESAIGVYVIAFKNGRKFVPCYVGKSDRRSFGHRLREHFSGSMLHELFLEHGALYFFLLPRVTPKGRMKKPAASGKALNSVDYLETALIGACLHANPNLRNKRNAKFHMNFNVPGYLNRKPETESKSAKAFAAMLQASAKP